MTLAPLSKRILQVKPSPTVSLNSKAAELAKAGKPIISLAVGEPDFATPQLIVDTAITSLQKGRTKYGAAGGGLELRRAITEKLLRENQLTFTPDQIVVGIGAKEILFHLMLSLLNEGDEVLIPAPYWVSYADQVIAAGGIPVAVPMPDPFLPGNFLDLNLIQKHASTKTVAIILNSPNNPAGYILNNDELKKLGSFLKQTNWWIVSDEIYEYMAFKKPHLSLLQLFPEFESRFILINGFSKGFAMTGWRVGYGAGPKPVMKLVQSLQSHSSTCLPAFIEDAAIVAIQKGRPLVDTQIQMLDARRQLAISELKKIPNLTFVEPEGAFYVFLDLRPIFNTLKSTPSKDLSAPKMTTSLEFAEFLLNELHLAVVPGEAFGAPGFLRISYTTEDQKIKEGINRIAKGLARIQS